MTLIAFKTIHERRATTLDVFGLNPAAVDKLRSFFGDVNLMLLAGGRHITTALLRTISEELRATSKRAVIVHINDPASAGEAVAAYVRGQLVVATTPAVDVIGALQSLADGGIAPSIVMALEPVVLTIHGIRRLCRSCAEPVGRMTSLEQRLADELGVAPMFRAAGCAGCNGSGFAGMIPHASFSIGTDPIPLDDIGWAAELLARGETTIEEVARVVSGSRAPQSP